ncbi:hypothetical protein MCOR25_011116 [Pyricularia grisea]|nr:hypothetical protein MCOR25_011116 [Pyricularia grisea]
MNTSGVSNDMIYNVNPVIIILVMPFVDRYLFPWLRRSGFALMAVTRLTWGFALEAAAMAMVARRPKTHLYFAALLRGPFTLRAVRRQRPP